MVEPLLTVGAAVGSLVFGGVGGYALGHRRGTDGPTDPGTPPEIASIADRLDCRPERADVERAIDDLTGAIGAVIDSQGLRDRTALASNAGAVERANTVRTAAENGDLCPEAAEGPAGHRPKEESQDRAVPAADETTQVVFPEAVASVRSEHATRTRSGDRLLTYLESAGDAPKPQFRDTLSTVIEQLNRHHAVAEALGDVPRSADAAELARSLERTGADLDGPEADGLGIIANRLSETARAKTKCETERTRLAEEVGQLCDTVDAHTGLSIDDDTDPVERLQSITNRIDEGTVTVGESRSSLQRIAGQLGLSPESRLGRDFVDVVTSQRADREECERILPAVVSAIERAETTSHRLEGVDADTVAQQADRLVEEFKALDTDGSAALEERAADLRSMVADAGDSDPVTVYGARQELRFYDRNLLPELKDPTTEGPEREELDTLSKAVEKRRSRIRTEYPSEYPEHNHNIPIHFLELVSTLQDLAEDARGTGHDQRALGYLRAAEEALDWIQELYERHAYSVLLEQLRG